MIQRIQTLYLLAVAALMAAVGMYLLCMTEGSFTLAYGDFLVFICAILFSAHILIIDYFLRCRSSNVIKNINILNIYIFIIN